MPDPNSSHGLEPHSPETDLLFGESGWFPPNSTIQQGRIIASHGSEGNAKLCATCHVSMFEVTDRETNEFVINVVGHLFKAIPCVDANGQPLSPQPADCEITATARSFAGCTVAGCHLTPQAAASALTVASGEVQSFADELLAQLEQVDPGLNDADEPIDATSSVFTVAEGAYFNYNLALHGGSPLAGAAHNPFLIRALLLASQQAVQDEYGVAPSTPKDYDAAIRTLLQRIQLDHYR